jgi:hypothetical protein
VYERQRLTPTGPSDVQVQVLSEAPGGPRVTVGSRTVRVPHVSQLVHYAHLVLVNVTASEADDRVVLHSGSVLADSGVVLLVGSSGWGKTTLTIELVRRGWGFLSDDFAILRPDGVIEPFPHRVNLTDNSVAMLGLHPSESELRLQGAGGLSKWMVDVDTIFPGSLAGAGRLSAVFVLSPAADSSPAAQPDGDTRPRQPEADKEWILELDHLPSGFETRLGQLPGVQSAHVRPQSAPARVSLRVEAGAKIVADLDELCAAEDVTILSALKGSPVAPSFAGSASAEQVEVVQALPILLSHSLSLSGRRFLHGTNGPVVMTALAHLRRSIEASGASVYWLTPGELSSTADLVQQISREAAP